jgi:diguanylate cyclase (GGDEF)-like protein
MLARVWAAARILVGANIFWVFVQRYGVRRSMVLLSAIGFAIAITIMVPINLITGGSLFTGFVVSAVICGTLLPLHVHQLGTVMLELQQARDTLYRSSVIDELTGAYNRRYAIGALAQLVERHHRDGVELSVLLIDIDHFKQINDTYGHAFGDQALVSFCRACGAQLRADDLFARYGGEEFVVLLPETSQAAAVGVAERLRHATESMTLLSPQQQRVRVTVSIGVAICAPPTLSTDHVLVAADRALYAAKRGGRNQLIVADQEMFEIAAPQVIDHVEYTAAPGHGSMDRVG